MRTSDFDYQLPAERIAQEPAERRDAARMMVLDRSTGAIRHMIVRELPGLLRNGDLLVVNDTRVIPARIWGRKEATGGKAEVLLLEDLGGGRWDVLIRASRRPRPGSRILLGSGRAEAELLEDGELGRARVVIRSDEPFLQVLEQEGQTPLPPYIARATAGGEQAASDRERYQTIYARAAGAVAAPTAGLHFTGELLDALRARGVGRTAVTLHVGLGTFRPVSVESIEDHVMDEERYEIPADAAEAIRRTRAAGGRIVAVGTTTVRTLESVAAERGAVEACSGRTKLFIRPPYTFRAVDVLLTNFHLPKSTLLMMVCAFAGREAVLNAYREAVREGYRFYSYGDCMLIV